MAPDEARDVPGSDVERERWERRYAAALDAGARIAPPPPPSAWVLERVRSLGPGARDADIGCGMGRHAVPLVRMRFRVIAVDIVERAVAATVRAEPAVEGIVADARALPIRDASFDAIVCVSYLDRSLFPTLRALLRPGGILVYETFTTKHAALVEAGRSHGPRTAAYLLEPGELRSLVTPLEIIDTREGLVVDSAGERHVASVVARK